MDIAKALTQPVTECHDWLEATMSDVTTEQAHWRPPGIANPICAVYAHVVVGADFGLHTLLNESRPLIVTDFAGRSGLSELMPMGDWHEWGTQVRMDLSAFREYARSVYASWNRYLASVTAADLDRIVDMSVFGMGQKTLDEYLVVQIQHFSCHCGEIASLKGLQGMTGYRPGTEDGIG